MTLPVTLPFHEDESPISLVSRLARANSYVSLQSLLGFTYTSREAIVRGDHDALVEISQLSGISIERLANASIVHQHPGSNWKLGRAIFNKEMRPGKMLRYCPHCVLNDMETGIGRAISRPYARSWWSCRGIEGCPEHGLKLVEHLVTSFDQRDDFATFVEQNVQRVHNHARDHQQSSAPLLDRFLRDRISQPAKANDLVDTLDVHIVAELSGYLGKFIAIHKLTELQHEATDQREWGFRLLCKGQAEMKRIIIETIEQKRPMVHFVLDFFGPVVLWLRRNQSKPAYEPVVTLFQEIAEMNMPFGPGMEFVRPVEKRYLYCVNSAHEEFGIHKERIKALIAQHGLTTRTHLHNYSIYFDAEAARSILEKANETINGKEAASILGLGETGFNRLIDAGILGSSEVRKKREYLRIQKSDVDDLVAKLTDDAEICSEENPEWITLEKGRDFGVTIPQIIEKIIEGNAKVRIKPGSEGLLKRLRVNFYNLKPIEAYTPVEGETYVSYATANLALGTSDNTLSELIKKGYVREKPRHLNSSSHRLVAESSIYEFKKHYISLTALREIPSINCVGVKSRLAALGVFPLLGRNNKYTSFYSLADLRKMNLIQS
ncbi:TniQ family protein [Brucella tritici]|nr:TniQ family protein [Brucella tritici]